MLDLKAEVEELWQELAAATERVLRSGQFIGGAEVEAFEAEAAEFLGVHHAMALNSGTDALVIGLEALGVGPGDEVITSPFSFFATSEAILRVGATPVFADIDPITLNLDPASVPSVITERTKVLVPVHLFGLPVDMVPLLELAKRHRLKVFEDCAQAFGAHCSGLGGRRAGAIGDLAAFSFYPTKNLGAYGDAGMLACKDAGLASLVRSLRNHGSKPKEKYLHDRLGHNSRLDALQAAILRVKLPRVDAWNVARREVAREYHAAMGALEGAGATGWLDGFSLPPLEPDHVFHQFTLQLPAARRASFERALTAAGIAFSRFYPVPLTRLPLGSNYGDAPEADKACERVVSIPCYPKLPSSVASRVAEIAERVLA